MQHILVEIQQDIATVTFNRPEQRNAISYDMWRRLKELAHELQSDAAVRCVVFRGAGEEAFSAGADIKDFEAHRFNAESAARYAEQFEGALAAVEEMTIPTVSMIHGFCVGGGLEFASVTDIRIAADGSKFGVPVARLGLTAGWNEIRRLVAVAGPAAVSYLLLSGRIVDHGTALRMGLVTEVVPAAALEERTYSLVRQIAAGAPLAAQDHKTMIGRILREPGLQSLTAAEKEAQFRVFDSQDFQEGRQAFIEKRRPVFKGR